MTDTEWLKFLGNIKHDENWNELEDPDGLEDAERERLADQEQEWDGEPELPLPTRAEMDTWMVDSANSVQLAEWKGRAERFLTECRVDQMVEADDYDAARTTSDIAYTEQLLRDICFNMVELGYDLENGADLEPFWSPDDNQWMV